MTDSHETKGKRLGEILIGQGILEEDDLKKALTIQADEGGLIGEVLVGKGFVTEGHVVAALARQFHYPYLAVPNFVINPDAIKRLPADIAHKYLCIPVDHIQDTLAVVMADPSDSAAVGAIQKACGCKIQAFVGTVSEIQTAIDRHYRGKKIKKDKRNEGLQRTLKRAIGQREDSAS